MKMCNCTQLMILITILFIISFNCALETPKKCSENKWRKSGENVCCDYCSPGQFMAAPCSATNPTICRTCPTDTFLDIRNNFKACFSCSKCMTQESMVVAKACSRQSDTLCACSQGYYYYQKGETCIRCQVCGKGEISIIPCTAQKDRVCKKCKLGETFARNGTCTPCSSCKVGEVKKSNCSLTSDVVCGKGITLVTPKKPNSTSILAPVISAAAIGFLIVILLIVAFCCCRKQLSNPCRRHGLVPSTVETRTLRIPTNTDRYKETKIEMPLLTKQMPMADLSYDYRQTLSKLLDSNKVKNNWKQLAGILGKSDSDIAYMEVCKDSPTITLIREYEAANGDPMVEDFIKILKKTNRMDAIKVLEEASKSWPRPRVT